MSRVEVTVPKIGLTAEEVTMERWTKEVGDTVAAGETIAEMETDKAVVDLEAPVHGVLIEIVVEARATVAIGTVVGYIDTANGD